MHEKPADAVRAKPDSSLVVSCRAVADGRADAVVSAGNTGAMLAAGLLHLRRLPGVMRPAIAVPIPARRGPSVLLDCGANADARPEHLLQFAHMGAVFAAEILELPSPRVRLLSIGEEPEKGNQLTLDAHALLDEDAAVDFARQRREPPPARGRGRRRRHRRLHRQRLPEAARGHDPHAARGAARGDHRLAAREARRPADPPGRAGSCAPASTRTPTAAPTCSACAGWP